MTSFAARRRARRRQELPTGELQLAAMVDMMINLLLFLLNLYGNSNGVQPSDDLSFARSTEDRPVHPAPSVVVSQAGVRVGDEVVGTWSAEGRAPDASEVAALRATLMGLAQGDDEPELLLQVDRRVPWTSVGPVLGVAGEAGFGNVRFVVASTEDPLGPR